MGKKVSPYSLRIGITQTWKSKWFSKRNYKTLFLEDISIRNYINKNLKDAVITNINISRSPKYTEVIITSGKPGVIVGRGGENIEVIQKKLQEKFNGTFKVVVKELNKPEGDAKFVAQSIADQISKRFPYRRVIKAAIEKAKDSGVKGIKITVSGRLNGVDISRSESYNYGTVPLHTLRAKINYEIARANTTYGVIGIKVWIYEGLVFKNKEII